MVILVTGANGQLGNEMRILAKNSEDKYIFTDVVDASEESITMLKKLAGEDINTDTEHLGQLLPCLDSVFFLHNDSPLWLHCYCQFDKDNYLYGHCMSNSYYSNRTARKSPVSRNPMCPPLYFGFSLEHIYTRHH